MLQIVDHFVPDVIRLPAMRADNDAERADSLSGSALESEGLKACLGDTENHAWSFRESADIGVHELQRLGIEL